MARQDDYQVVYRSVSDYARIFETCGLGVHHVERIEPYVLLQIGCELVRSWKETAPDRFQALQAVGHLTYFMLRLGNPWITRVPRCWASGFRSWRTISSCLSRIRPEHSRGK